MCVGRVPITSLDKLVWSVFRGKEGAFLALSLETPECGNRLVPLVTHPTKKMRIDELGTANICESLAALQMVYVSTTRH